MSETICNCEFRVRQWNPITGKCEACGNKFEVSRGLNAAEPPVLLAADGSLDPNRERTPITQTVPAEYGTTSEEKHLLGKISLTIEERGKIYGEPLKNHENISKIWTAILEAHYQMKLPHDLAPHVVTTMMAALKVIRNVAPFGYHEDNYIDGIAYMLLSRRCDARKERDKNVK